MKTSRMNRLWVVLWMVAVLILVSGIGATAEELAKEQVARLALGVADIGTLDPHFATKIGEGPVVQMVYEALLRNPPDQIDIENIRGSCSDTGDSVIKGDIQVIHF